MALPACPLKDSVKMNAGMGDWQSDTEWGKLKQWGEEKKKLPQCHFVHHKTHTD